ncbi:MAG: hypothetical protein AAB442_03215 [Patescibacteria group bacterium]
MFSYLSSIIGNEVGSTVFLIFAIGACAFFFEDLTSIIVGVLAAEGYVPVSLSLCALYLGIMLGDTALYAVGALARTRPALARYINHDFTASFRTWLETHYVPIILAGHFVPGLRFTTYIASGFFRRPIPLFAVSAIVSGLVLGIFLFSLSYWFGSATVTWMRPVRWFIVILFIGTLMLISRQGMRTYRAMTSSP